MESSICPYCQSNVKEDIWHVFCDCEAWNSIRETFKRRLQGPNDTIEGGDNEVFQGLGILVESQWQKVQRNLLGSVVPFTLPPKPDGVYEVDDRLLDLHFVDGHLCWWPDGACIDQSDDHFRRAAYAGFLAEDHPGNFAFHVEGPIQTNQLAELLAALIIMSWSWIPTLIPSDSDWVVTRLLILLEADNPMDIRLAAWDHSPIWAMMVLEIRKKPPGFFKAKWVKAHATDDDVTEGRTTVLDRFGNDGADALASAKADTHPTKPTLEEKRAFYNRWRHTAFTQAMMVKIWQARCATQLPGEREEHIDEEEVRQDEGGDTHNLANGGMDTVAGDINPGFGNPLQ